MKKPWLAAIFNFFLMGLGTFYLGKRKIFGAALTCFAIVMSWVEFQVKVLDLNLYMVMFISVFVVNIFFAYDAYQEAKIINNSTKE